MSNQKSIKTAMAHIERAIAEPNNTMSDGKALKEIMRQLNFAKAALVEALGQLNFAKAALVEALEQQEPVAWMPIEQMYPQAKAIDILMGDGSILCAVLPQFDGDLWWEGSGTGEKFIDPKYANVTHWRIHDERTSTPASKPWVGLTDEEVVDLKMLGRDLEFVSMKALRRFARDIEATLKEKNA